MNLRAIVAGAVMLGFALPGFARTRPHRAAGQHSYIKRVSHLASAKAAGQRTIDDGRATEIQSALQKAGYLSEDPSGHWDSSTQAAMQRYQSDHGWQTKLMPDSRAIIKLGLGPHVDAETVAVASNPLP